jgi:aspartyl-tRNA(Asn)/glutamyl-tRNA(Gln) amidotransferase subunit A
MDDRKTLAALAEDLAKGRVTAEALAEAALARATAADGEGARVFTRIEPEDVRIAARESDRLRRDGRVRSPLEGLPISVKDLFDIRGQQTRAGSRVLADAPLAERDAPVVRRLKAAGAVIVGRTNMTEFAYSGLGINPHYGTPLNPFDRAAARIPGGSSSGAAVSVTDGMASGAIGTDTGGSCRIPAALCGLVGYKPTARRVPLQGAVPLSSTLDSIGPLARSVSCCVLLDRIISGDGEGPLPVPPSVKGLRLALPKTLVREDMDASVARAFEAALDKLRRAGALVDEIEIPEFTELAAINARGGFPAAEAWHWHRGHIERGADLYDPRVISRIRRGAAMTAADYIDVLQARTRWIKAVERRIRGCDALLMPTVPMIAPRIADLADEAEYGRVNLLMLRNPTLINFLDGCAISVPCQARGDAPVGLMLAARRGQDRRLFAVAGAVERLLEAR